LTAYPSSGYTFAGWSGSCAGTSICSLTMNEIKNAYATFTQNTALLSISKSGTGGGTVTSNVGGINCGASCAAVYNQYTSVTMTATPDATSYFSGWSGACSGTGGCSLTMDAAKNLGAQFDKYYYSLSVSRTGHGTVEALPYGIYCGVACSGNVASGTMVTMTASPDAGYTFTGWSGACTGTSSTCSVSMSTARSVTATFS
jgi:uncharacterized repeat protein (TIGR02543 family)